MSAVGITGRNVFTSLLPLLSFLLMMSASVQGQLNDACTSDADCSSTNAHCNSDNNICVCDPGFAEKQSGKCEPRLLEDPCSNDTDCFLISNGVCSNGECSCTSGYRPQGRSKEACEPRTIGDLCETAKDCSDSIPNSECHDVGRRRLCLCQTGFVDQGGNCVARRLGDRCQNHADCDMVMNNTKCVSRKCTCDAGYIPMLGGASCRPRPLGDICEGNLDCNNVIENSHCSSNKVCECNLGFRPFFSSEGSACLKFALGDLCERTRDCQRAIPKSTCLQRKCDCDRGLLPNENQTSCEIVPLHGPCKRNIDCKFLRNSECVGDTNTCQCKAGFEERDGEGETGLVCVKKLIGDACVSNENCTLDNSVCKNNVCACAPGFKASDNLDECYQRTLAETECQGHGDCSQHFNNSICTEMSVFAPGYCRCDMRYFEDEDGFSCLFRYLEDSCQTDDDCTFSIDNSMCVDNRCQCNDTYSPSSDKMVCNLRILGGMFCDKDSDCTSLVASSFCDVANSATCVCNMGYYSNEQHDFCLEKQLGDACSFDEECDRTNPNSRCSASSNKCECASGYAIEYPQSPGSSPSNLQPPALSRSGGSSPGTSSASPPPFCVKRTIEHHSCDADDDCVSAVANSNCGSCGESSPDSKCRERCASLGSVGTDKMTVSDILGFVANGNGDDTPCSRVRTCLCDAGYFSVQGDTVCRGRQIMDRCEKDEDCSGHIPDAVCWKERQICYCRSGFKSVGREECKKRIITDICTKDEDCADAVTHSHCELAGGRPGQGVCQCDSGYRVTNFSMACRKRQIGDQTCVIDSDCNDAVNGSYCHQGMCVCLPGYQVTPDLYRCDKRQLNTHFCDADVDCSSVIDDSVCKNFRCVCASGFYSTSDEECVKRKIGDANCKVDLDCNDAVNNSACVNGVCRCVSGFHPKSDNKTCTRRRIFDSTCTINPDCADAVENSRCNRGRCVCNSGHYASSDRMTCIKRKIGDGCNVGADCYDVILNSQCVEGLCTCEPDFDTHNNNSECVSAPSYIGSECHVTDQCQRIDPVSTCELTHDPISTCVCPKDRFVASNASACIALPQAIGDSCSVTYHCTAKIPHTFCNDVIHTCQCLDGFFEDEKTVCHSDPMQLGDYCRDDSHCAKMITKSTCEQENSTCVCEYGYTQETSSSCTERHIIPPYVPYSPSTPVVCQKSCKNWTNSLCIKQPGHAYAQCRCDYRHARAHNDTKCVPIQTYELTMALVKEADKYDYVPLKFIPQYKSSKLPAFKRFAERISLNGLMKMFETSSLKDRYVASDVTAIQNLDITRRSTEKGVRATILLHLKADYLNAISLNELNKAFEEHFNSSGGELGASRLKISMPYSTALELSDYDECEMIERNDCSQFATCLNTLGSFMCVCKSRYEDVSKSRKLRPGRECVIPSTTDDNSDLCSDDDCETRWEFVALALTLFLLIIMSFIVYEIIQRKQNFTARKLYAKFGTTKIRKLRQASMRRIQEAKKRKKEETKKKKEENKQQKEELKRQKSEKRKQKSEEKKQKQEEKKQRENERKEAKEGLKRGRSEADEEGSEERSVAERSPTPPMEIMHPPSVPFSVTSSEGVSYDASSLPGSVNTPQMSTSTRRVVSPIEESPV